MGLHNYYQKKNKPEKIVVRNDYTYPNVVEELKRYSAPTTKHLEKKSVYYCPTYRGVYEFSAFANYLKTKDSYEVYLVVGDDKGVASRLLYKEIKNKWLAKLYMKLLTKFTQRATLKKIVKVVTKKKI